MPATQIRGPQVLDGTIQRSDLDVATVGQAVVRKIVQGTGISIIGDGADAGTGDVTAALNLGVVPTWTGLHNFKITDAVTNTASSTAIFTHSSTGIPATSFEGLISLRLESDSVDDRAAGAIGWRWSNAIDANRTSIIRFFTVNNAVGPTMVASFYGSGGWSQSTTDPGAGFISATTGFKVGAAALNFSHLAGAADFATQVSGKPTTLAGYGITDPVVLTSGSYADPTWITSLASSKLTGTVAAAQMPAYTGDVTSSAGGTLNTLVNIPNGTNAAGYIVWAATTGPASPASGFGRVYFDTADGRLHDKDSSGTVATTVVPDAGATNNFLTGVGFNGVFTRAQPTFANLNGSIATTQGGLPTGGSTNQVLAKASATNYDTAWVAAGGTGTVTNIATTSPITGGPITGTGTIALSVASNFNFSSLQTITTTDAGTANIPYPITLVHNSSAAALAGLGAGILLQAKTDTTNNRTLCEITSSWTVPADATRASKISIRTASSGSFVNNLILWPSGGMGVNTSVDPGSAILLANTGATLNRPVILQGSNTNDSAAAGNVGETVNSIITSAVAYTTGQTKNLTSISLTAGDWDVRGIITWQCGSVPGSGLYNGAASIGTTTNTSNLDGTQSYGALTSLAGATTGVISCPLPERRFSLSATTTVYLVGAAPAFASGSMNAIGYIEARRIR